MAIDTSPTSAELAFPFLRSNHRPDKPRTRGVTEIRGPYYSVMGPRYLEDVLETMGEHVDALKFAGGSFTLMPEPALRAILDTAHEHDVLVSTGGFIEHCSRRGRAPLSATSTSARGSASTSSRFPPASSASPPMTSCGSSTEYSRPA
jgi:hypothetical protein